jgi:hypothetical protein
MSLREIRDVNIVADRGAVFGGVVVAEYSEVGAPADGDLGQVGEEIVGDSEGVFAEGAAWVGSCRVKVAERGGFPGGVCGDKVLDDVFARDFCSAIGICRAAGADFSISKGLGGLGYLGWGSCWGNGWHRRRRLQRRKTRGI